MSDKKYSEEFIHAFVDNQLSPEEKGCAYPLIEQDAQLNRQVCEIRKLRDLVQLAYKEPPPMANRQLPRHHTLLRTFTRNAVAVVLLAVGMILGWALHGGKGDVPQRAESQTSPLRIAQQTNAKPNRARSAIATPVPAKEVKIVLHLNHGSTERMRETLDEAQNVIEFYRRSGTPARVEVIANGDGLNLLRADVSPFAKRIGDMQRKYDNLVFAACQNTIDRLKREQGIQAQLVPEAVIVDSGVAQIILLQQQGWAYIQV